MRLRAIILPSVCALLIGACSSQQPAKSEAANEVENKVTDDSTIYGLACDGCTDSIIVVLSNVENDPDTFSIIGAMQNHQCFGRPLIGDRLAVVRNAEDSTVADIVINLDGLMATWCYKVTPTLRKHAGMSDEENKRILAMMPDSIREALMVEREYGYQFKSDYSVQPIGMAFRATTSDEEGPLEYPSMKRYRQWRIHQGRLILTETKRDSLGNIKPIGSDTAQLVLMRRDSLVLRFADGDHSYYKKEVSEE